MKELILKQYGSLADESLSVKNKCNILNNIIEMKIEESQFHQVGQSISKDFKLYFRNLVLLQDDTSTLYDSIKIDCIKAQLEQLEYAIQIDLIEYFKRKLNVAGHEYYSKKLSSVEYELKIKHYKKDFLSFKSLYNLVTTFPLHGLFNVLISLLIIYIVFALFTLPAFYPYFSLFEIQYHDFSDHFYLNHFTNTLSYLFALETDFKIKPVNTLGVILAVIVKITFILIVINTLAAKALEYIKR